MELGLEVNVVGDGDTKLIVGDWEEIYCIDDPMILRFGERRLW